jgi:hypothetical protein
MSKIDISMFNTDELKLTLFYGLVNKSVSASRFHTNDITISQRDEALEAIKKGYIDRFNGRPIKADLSENTFDSWCYNRDNGSGAAEYIIKNIKTALGI